MIDWNTAKPYVTQSLQFGQVQSLFIGPYSFVDFCKTFSLDSMLLTEDSFGS